MPDKSEPALALPAPRELTTIAVVAVKVRATWPGEVLRQVTTALLEDCMPLDRRWLALLGFGVLLIAATGLSAADGPPGKDDSAPPEKFSSEQLGHWAYQPVKRTEPKAVKDSRWVRNPIDRFIQGALENLGLDHSPAASRIALIRRVTVDLAGRPPATDEVAAFLGDTRPDAYERLVDRLLASPEYGIRWGQHWLDLAHYADTNGFELDAERPDAWRYRDWVVRSLNADLPYDRFLTLQLAGDVVKPGNHEALVATGFGRCGPREVVGGNVIPEEKRQTELSEITSTVGSVFLGLTVGCARCHDHKFDAIPTTDYYRLQAFFATSDLDDVSIAEKAERDRFDAVRKQLDEKAAPLKKQLAALEAPYRDALKASKMTMLSAEERAVLGTPAEKRTPAQKKLAQGLGTSTRITWEEVAAAVSANATDMARREKLKRDIYEIERLLPRSPAHAMALVEKKSRKVDTFVLRRGDYKSHGPKVAPRPPGVVLASQPGESGSFKEPSAGRRPALAAWLSGANNPLTARVIVNRLWQHHFGRGIVATPSDFGVRGEAPSHPELLDWLASELVREGWRLKPLHRLMVTSATYQQSSKATEKLAADDPENTLFGRMLRRRLDAEGVRDAMLAASGELNSRMEGPGVLAPIEKEIEDLIFTEAEAVDLWPEDRNPSEHLRRSLYLFRKRNVRYPLFDAFDAPDTQSACPRRATSTHALQALALLNSEFATARARALAGRVLRERASGGDGRIVRAYGLVLAREATQEEVVRARRFLSAQTDLVRKEKRDLRASACDCPGVDPTEAAAWVDFSLALLNCNEFLYVP